MHKLLLSVLGFPEKFLKSKAQNPSSTSKQQFIEMKIIKAINDYNSKLNVTSIEYFQINSLFNNLEFGKYGGLIVHESKINSTLIGKYSKQEYYCWQTNGEWFCWRIVAYIFLSDYEIKGRNIVSQSIFPEIIDFMAKYEDSPSYSIANHPIYFLNFIDSEITASSIIKQLAGMIASKIEYIEVFTNNKKLEHVPKDIEEYLTVFTDNYVKGSLYYTSEFYEVDIKNRITRINDNKLKIDQYLKFKDDKGLFLEFNGSSEKFYWMEVIPIIILSWENGFEIDYSVLSDFYLSNIRRFSERDDKFKRFGYLIKYIEKLMLRSKS